MRFYGQDQLGDLQTGLANARDSVNPTSYSTQIANTTVHSDRVGLRSVCVDAADDALGHVVGIKHKLDVVLSKIIKFYNEVDETSAEVSGKVAIAQGILDTLNPTLSKLCDSLLGIGEFQGVKVTPDIINGVVNNLANTVPYYTAYYMGTVENTDGSYNFDSYEELSNHINTRVANGEPITAADIAKMNALSFATADYIDAHDLDDDDLSRLLTGFVSRSYVQDFESPTASELNPGLDYVYDEDYNTFNRIWFNYSLTPAGNLFAQCLNETVSLLYNVTFQDYSSIDQFMEKHDDLIQFSDCLMSFCRENQTLALPYIITDMDEYSEYRNTHCTDPSLLYNGELDPAALDSDHYRVEMPFFGELNIERREIDEGSFSDPNDAAPHSSHISVITYSNDFGTCDYRYTFNDVNNNMHINTVSYTTVWSCETDFCRDIEQSRINMDNDFINSTRPNIPSWWSLVNASNIQTAFNGCFVAPYNALNRSGVELRNAPNLGGGAWTSFGSGVAFLCTCSGVWPLQIVGAVVLIGCRVADFSESRQAAIQQNALTDAYLANRDTDYDTIYFCRNTNASGSYYADNTTDPTTVTALPNFYADRSEAQILVSYANVNGRGGSSQVLGRDPMNTRSYEQLCAQDANDSTDYNNFSDGVRTYYSLFWSHNTGYPNFDSLSTDDINDVCNAFYNDWWSEHPGEKLGLNDINASSISIPGINCADYR